MHLPTSTFFCLVLLPLVYARVTGPSDPSLNTASNLTTVSAIGTEISSSWSYESDLGRLNELSVLMTTVLTMHEIARSNWNDWLPDKNYSYEPYRDVEIMVGSVDEVGPIGDVWQPKVFLTAIVTVIKNIVSARDFTGGIGVGSVGLMRRRVLTFAIHDPRLQVNGQALSAPSNTETLQDKNVNTLQPQSESTTTQPPNYKGWESIGADAEDEGSSASTLSATRRHQYYFDTIGQPVSRGTFLTTICAGLEVLARRNVDRPSEYIASSLDGFQTVVSVVQYWGDDPPADKRDLVMTVGEALNGLRSVARYTAERRQYGVVTMVMEREEGKPIGIFRMTQPNTGGRVSEVTAVS